jgi:hypothetical protein
MGNAGEITGFSVSLSALRCSILRIAMLNTPHCDAQYNVARIEAPNVGDDPEVTCVKCGGWLESREGTLSLEYNPVFGRVDGASTS